MTANSINLRPLWDALLEIYEVFAAICDRHGLRYCADCGTALGAVRHGGFIPWDDDMDLEMPRPDYEKFVKVVKCELPEGLRWVDRHVDHNYEHAFGKIMAIDSEKVAKISRLSGLDLSQGVFIDIFPLDGYPDSMLARVWRKVQSRLWEFQMKYDAGWKTCDTTMKKVFWIVGFFVASRRYKIRNCKELADAFEKRAKQYEFGSTEYCVSIGVSRFFDDKPYPVKYFGTPRRIAFDKVEMMVQQNVEEYLESIFGDYMQLPPPDRRRPAHAARK